MVSKFSIETCKIFIADVIIAVGDYDHKKAELLSVNDSTWADIESYPFVMGIDIFNHLVTWC